MMLRATGKPMTTEEVEAMIEKIADAQEDYNWEEWIVDLMKLLKLDSSLSARKAASAGTRLHRRSRRLSGDEHLAAQAGHDEACGRRRRGAGQP
jgi:hypothetical protein